MTLNAIIFDCDGVLIDSEALLMRADMESLAEIGMTYTPAEFQKKYLGTNSITYFETLDREYKNRHGKLPPKGTSDTFHTRRRDILENELAAIKGVAGFVEKLHLKKAVASNTQMVSWLSRKLTITGLYDIFAPHIYAAECVKRGKPAPDLYLYAAEKLGEKPENCLVIEDSPRGVEAGVAAGMSVIGFTGAAHVDEDHAALLIAAGATDVVETIESLETYLKGLLQKNHKKADTAYKK